MNKYHWIFILIVGFTLSCTSNKGEKTESIQDSNIAIEVVYEVFVQSYIDSNNDSIGDINGLRSRLDHIKELGANAIWLMPIMPSPSYHKYDVTDYKGIHPDYGTMEDFKEFVEVSHKNDIRVIVDFIINHTSSKHPWFIEAGSNKDSRYRDYYVWGDKDSIEDNLAKKEISFDSDNITQWHASNGDTSNHDYYYGFFSRHMPDLNFDNPLVRNEIYDIGRYWLQEVGVDGFRMDAAKHIYPDDRADDNTKFWIEFKQEMEKVKPDVYIVGEVWSDSKFQAQFSPGFSSLFNFDLAFSILESVRNEKAVSTSISGHGWKIDSTQSFISLLIKKDELFKDKNPNYTDAIFLSNHDQNRYLSVLDNDVKKAKLASTILFTLPGIPYIYYGEEIGMKGKKPDENIREPFLWNSLEIDLERTKWMEPHYSADGSVESLKKQQNDPESFFNHYKKLISLRKNVSALTNGKLSIIEAENDAILSYSLTLDDTVTYVYHNLSDESIEVVSPNIGEVILGKMDWRNKLNKWEIPSGNTLVLSINTND